MRLALTCDEYCRAAEPLAVRRLAVEQGRLLLILGRKRSALISEAAPDLGTNVLPVHLHAPSA